MNVAKILLLIVCCVVTACTTNPPANVPEWVGKMKNACLPEAIAMTQGLKREDIQAKVLSIHTKDWGHATCAYLYPPGKNRLWVWDSNWQSVPVRAWWNDPKDIAKAWMKWRYDETPVEDAFFQEDRPAVQLPEQK